MKAYQNDVPTRVALLEQSIGQINDTLKEIRDDIREVKSDMKSFRDHVDDRLDKLNNRIWNLFFWMIGGGGSILYVIAKTNHWLT